MEVCMRLPLSDANSYFKICLIHHGPNPETALFMHSTEVTKFSLSHCLSRTTSSNILANSHLWLFNSNYNLEELGKCERAGRQHWPFLRSHVPYSPR